MAAGLFHLSYHLVGLDCQFNTHHIMANETIGWQDKCNKTAAIFSLIIYMALCISIFMSGLWLFLFVMKINKFFAHISQIECY